MGSPSLARLVSIQVGLPTVHGRTGAVDPLDQPWRTGYFKVPVAGPVCLGRDEPGRRWPGEPPRARRRGQGRARLRGQPLPAVANRARAARTCPTARSPRTSPSPGRTRRMCVWETCTPLARRASRCRSRASRARTLLTAGASPGLTERVAATGRHGWYVRVLAEGEVVAGDRSYCSSARRPSGPSRAPPAPWPHARKTAPKPPRCWPSRRSRMPGATP